MPFANIKDHIPELRCSCGHVAAHHLYCGEHICLASACLCTGFNVAPDHQNATILAQHAELQACES